MLWLSEEKWIMPVAKNRKLADARGISTFLLNQRGLPLSFVSAKANSSRCVSMSSAIRFNIPNLSSTGVMLHEGKIFSAA
jgi:hypothetical protein